GRTTNGDGRERDGARSRVLLRSTRDGSRKSKVEGRKSTASGREHPHPAGDTAARRPSPGGRGETRARRRAAARSRVLLRGTHTTDDRKRGAGRQECLPHQ